MYFKYIKRSIFFMLIMTLCCMLPLSAMDSVNKNAGVASVWDNGYYGEGMVVAILDLEFDVNHELFKLSEDTVPKLTEDDITAKIEIGLNCSDTINEINKSPYINEKIPFAYDYVNGSTFVSGIDLIHGTHIAGIIGANKIGATDFNTAIDGVAPEAQLILMKIGDSKGNIDYNAAIAALSDAISLGADVINLSWGQTAGFGNSIEEFDFYSLIRRAMNQGIDVVVSAGNTSRSGNMSEYDKIYAISDPLASEPDYGLVAAPSLLDNAISVASYNNDSIKAKGHIETYSGKKIIYSEAYQTFADILAKPNALLDYVVVESKGTERMYNDSSMNYKNKLAVMEYTNDTLMMTYLKNKGVVGIIFYSQYENNLYLRTVKSAYIPVVFISYDDGMALINSEKYQLTLYEYPSIVEVENPVGNTMSYYSSWGTTSSLSIKPDITAIGGNVYSTSPGDQYETMSGTSMASPVIAGALTLVKQYIKETSLDSNQYTARQLLMTTAEPIVNPETGIEYSPRQQGAGLLKVDRAIQTDILIYNIDTLSTKIELGDNIGNEFAMEFTVRNLTNATLEYDINASIFTDAYYYDKTTKKYFTADYSSNLTRAQIYTDGGTVNINMNSRTGSNSDKITIPANTTVTIKLYVILDKMESRSLTTIFSNGYYVEGYIYLTPIYDGGLEVSVPYMGFYGDWNDASIFDDEFYLQSLGSFVMTEYGVYEIELGKNIFTDDTVNRSLYAISPGSDSNGDVLLFLSKSLRNYYLQEFFITDSNGDIVYKEFIGELRTKAYFNGDEVYTVFDYIWDGTDSNNSKYIYPDGFYYLNIVASINADGTDSQVYKIAFYIDTQKPTMKDNKVVTYDDRTEYEFTVEDNLAIQMVRIFYNYEDKSTLIGEMITYTSANPIKSTTVNFDITEFLEDSNTDGNFYIEIIDYALNSIIYKITP